jgi:putative ABC transport system permease protein
MILGQAGALQVHKAGFLKLVVGSPLALDFDVTDDLLAKIEASPHVTAAAPRIMFGAMVNASDTTSFAMVTAIDPAREFQVCTRRADRLAKGKLPAAGENDRGVFAAELARRLGLAEGGTAAFLSSDKDGVLNGVEMKLSGTQGLAGMPGAESKLAVMPLQLAQELLRMPGRATEIAVGLDDLDKVDEAREALAAALGPQWEVTTWKQMAPTIVDVVQYQNTALSVVASIFLFIALLGIANAMLMSVLERTREIGTMMAVGMRRRRILVLFLIEAGLLASIAGTLGALAGTGLVGYLGIDGIRMLGAGGGMIHLVPFVTAQYAALVVAVATAGSLVASFSPAWRASRLRPVEALTHV